MPEQVQTGGLKSFSYRYRERPRLDEREKREFEDAYDRAEERKERERRNKIIFWIVFVLIVLAVGFGIWYFFR